MIKGDRVEILNTNGHGKIIHEGTATVIAVIGPDQAIVRFDGERAKYRRFVDPAAQANPAAFVSELNARLAEAAR